MTRFRNLNPDQDHRYYPNQPSSAAVETGARIEELQREVERLLMITEALWTLVREQGNCNEDELLRRVLEIDLRDGRIDSRKAPAAPQECPKCGRTLQKRGLQCLFCGTPVKTSLFER